MSSSEQNKALLCLYLYDAKLKIDSLLYISTLSKDNINFDIDLYTDDIIRLFYINLRYATELMCKAFGYEKVDLKNDHIFESIFSKTDKDIVHKDDKYRYTEISLKSQIEEFENQLDYVYAYLKKDKRILENFAYEYYCFDPLLYRIINPVANVKFIKKSTTFYISDDNENNVKPFKNPDILKEANYEKTKNEWGIEVSNGICKEEKAQIMDRTRLLQTIKWVI